MIIKPIAVEYDMWYFTSEDDASFFGVYPGLTEPESAHWGWLAIFPEKGEAQAWANGK